MIGWTDSLPEPRSHVDVVQIWNRPPGHLWYVFCFLVCVRRFLVWLAWRLVRMGNGFKIHWTSTLTDIQATQGNVPIAVDVWRWCTNSVLVVHVPLLILMTTACVCDDAVPPRKDFDIINTPSVGNGTWRCCWPQAVCVRVLHFLPLEDRMVSLSGLYYLIVVWCRHCIRTPTSIRRVCTDDDAVDSGRMAIQYLRRLGMVFIVTPKSYGLVIES